ncbi:hypothetical protein BLA60_40535 [Actinophytocola xinjiangensis]|uniref:HTH crp-type domain-containing protein n=1 Tax=Actinophytocola xinjiangensis TaxID=485602 RepID=A0A7Z0WDK7_9PSEU|nr:Crp/Fnr family transcriptional regulator [Actinophytocola xinjiangensis]OLF04476.1 hypothetical protein BLA60_40535 [Actinophytocola xinjiangensis]
MGLGLVEETVRWHRRGMEEPWLRDSFMAGLSAEAIHRLERHATLLTDTDEIDWTAADAPVVIVLAGTVKVYLLRWDGHLAIDRIAGIGDVVNGEHLFTDHPVPMRLDRTYAAAMAVPRRKFRDLLDQDREIQEALWRAFAHWHQEAAVRHSHSGRRVERRLWAFLVGLARRHGTSTPQGIRLIVGLTQADLAAAIGASHQSVEAALRRLRRAGKLTTNYGWCVLHEVPSEDELDQAG